MRDCLMLIFIDYEPIYYSTYYLVSTLFTKIDVGHFTARFVTPRKPLRTRRFQTAISSMRFDAISLYSPWRRHVDLLYAHAIFSYFESALTGRSARHALSSINALADTGRTVCLIFGFAKIFIAIYLINSIRAPWCFTPFLYFHTSVAARHCFACRFQLLASFSMIGREMKFTLKPLRAPYKFRQMLATQQMGAIRFYTTHTARLMEDASFHSHLIILDFIAPNFTVIAQPIWRREAFKTTECWCLLLDAILHAALPLQLFANYW